METIYSLIGKRVKYLRRLRNITQGQLAEKANLSVNYISQIETGVASPTIATLLVIAQELNVEIKELFNFEQIVDTTTRNERENQEK
ncbi:MAG TPA: helix-turn-helix transcriptional regulator [Ktedonosporobacter sp.]|nr:helix-turn-helix transcriptional regulator [Ktedonosporobacter sp.]